MRSKPWDKCRFFQCPHPTWSGKIEREWKDRICSYHMPYRLKKYAEFAAQGKASAKPKKIVLAKANPLCIPLFCVFKSFQISEREGSRRVVFTHDLCGKHAPRSKSKKSEPKYPNRFGEPLCEEHRSFANNQDAFPDEVSWPKPKNTVNPFIPIPRGPVKTSPVKIDIALRRAQEALEIEC